MEEIDVNWAEELRKITNEFGHLEKGNEIDSSGNDIDEVVFRFMYDLYQMINEELSVEPLNSRPRTYNSQNTGIKDDPSFHHQSKWYFNMLDNVKKGEYPYQKLILTGGNDKYHAENKPNSKHVKGLAIDFRLIDQHGGDRFNDIEGNRTNPNETVLTKWGGTLRVEDPANPGTLVDSPKTVPPYNEDKNGVFTNRPADNYHIRRHGGYPLHDLNTNADLGDIWSGGEYSGEWRKFHITELKPTPNVCAWCSHNDNWVLRSGLYYEWQNTRGWVMHQILGVLKEKYSAYGMRFVDHYQEPSYWPTAMHFHVQFDSTALDIPFATDPNDLGTPTLY